MRDNHELQREGDINFSPLRKEWMNQLSAVSVDRIEADERAYMRQSMSTPCLNSIVDAEGCYITDVNGRKYLDFHGNSIHQIGYKNPYVTEAVKKQLDDLPFIPRRFTADIAVKAAEALINKTTSKDYKVLFTPSGSAAVGLALKIARKWTGKHKVISMWESFHGAGLDTIAAGGEYVFKKDMGPQMPGMLKAIPFNAYRNLLGSHSHEIVSTFCLDYLEYMIQHEGEIGAILLEPIRATDTHIPPISYFTRLRKICDEYGILLIFDEIPTALMRSGRFYVHQNFEIEPDILVLGKGLGGGVIPQAAVLTRTQYDCAADISLGHYTHEKPALGSAAICATINYMDDMKLQEQCINRSEFVRGKLEALGSKHACIGDIRIAGLLISIELVRSRDTKEKNEELAERVLYYCLENGLSFKLAGGNCITWHPPLIVSEVQLTFAINLLDEGLSKYS
ncbi:aspartate aminotransferase family protein [Paenibacillus sp. FSL K6-3166]|uniref:(R)-1-hydroxy-2-aminoethylphosphonate ammonia-lyase n=1 Tax=unclassified Paenibacillus TaxID=185978 RepID=UPI000BA13BEB|nr:aspartate aminotransferase family protein [Paenibacillus sp. VTT E-133291]OZQ94751.1 aspartate aminotransferase family protein [Paenibacillus sp. VTT E-133291]